MPDTSRPIESAIAFTAQHGGGTFDAETLEPLSVECGYAVGGRIGIDQYGDQTPLISRPIPANTAHMVAEMAAHARNEECYVGTWLDGGQLTIELTDVYPNLYTACRIAKRRGQVAIYSFADSVSINVDATLALRADNGVGDRDAA